MELQHGNILLRDATKADAKQLAEWWNDGAVMAHAGFPNGLGTTEEEVAEDIGTGALIIEEAGKPIGEANYRIVDDKVAEIGIKICVFDCQNRGIGKIVLSMLIRYLFDNGFDKTNGRSVSMNLWVSVKCVSISIRGLTKLESCNPLWIMNL